MITTKVLNIMNNFGKIKKSLVKSNKLRAYTYTSHLQILTDIWRCLNMSAIISSKLYSINQSIQHRYTSQRSGNLMQILKNYNITHTSITTLTQLGKGLMYMRD